LSLKHDNYIKDRKNVTIFLGEEIKMGICMSKVNTNIVNTNISSNKKGDISNTSKKKHSAENKLNDDVSKKTIKYIDLNQSQKNQLDDLLKGIQSNDISRLTLLKNNRINVNVTDNLGIALLDWAIVKGHTKIVLAFIIAGADLNVTDKYGTPLMKAVKLGKTKVVEALVNAGAELNTTDRFGKTALHYAVNRHHKEIVKLLLDKGAKVNVTDRDEKTPLHYAVNRHHKEIVEALVNAGEDIVQLLLDSGANVNAKAKFEETPLHIAAKAGKTEVIKALLNAGADVDARDFLGMTALDWAARYGQLEMVKALVIAGADVNVPNNYGLTALDLAKKYGHYDKVKNAIKAGKKELIAQLGALEHDHMWGEKSTGKLAALCKKNSTKNDHNRGDVLNSPYLQRYIWGFNNKPSLRLKKARQYSAEAATKIQAMARGNLVRKKNKALNQKSNN